MNYKSIPDETSIVNRKSSNRKSIELRSEEVQEVMSRMPPWILRSGITVMFCVVLLLLAGSWFFKYPDSVQAEIVITTLDPPVSILARSTGKLDNIYVGNNQPVSLGEILGVIENPAHTEDVIKVSQWLLHWESRGCDIDSIWIPFAAGEISLGTLQPAYAGVLNSLNDYNNYKKQNYYALKITAQERQLVTQKEYHAGMQVQTPVIAEQYRTARSMFKRDSTLYTRGLLSDDDYDVARKSFLQAEQSYLGFETTLKQTQMQLIQSETALLDLHQQAMELESRYKLTLRNAMEALAAQVRAWEKSYLLISPVHGRVNFMGIWGNNQNVQTGEVIFTIIPEHQYTPKGKAMLPVQGSGKVKEGQRVHVRLNNFPDQEFGFLQANITSISNIPTPEGAYVVEVEFPQGMKTNYGVELPLTQQMHGTAEIITEDLRLIERLFMPVKKILKEQTISSTHQLP